MAPFPTDTTTYVSFDGGVRLRAGRLRPDRYRFFEAGRFSAGPTIARGAGLSYAAASFGGGSTTVEHRQLNRVLELDSEHRTVRVEAGMSLGELSAFLAPRGLFLPVQPGHPSITVGGCIASDAHGKGHARHGTFSSQVRGVTLFHPSHGWLDLSHERDAELLELTCGGYGLTGHILHAELEAKPLPRALETRVLPVRSFAELPKALADAEDEWEFVYSWHDMSRSESDFGRGFLTVARPGTPATRRVVEPVVQPSTLDAVTRQRLRFQLFGRSTTRLVNLVHGRRLASSARAGSRPLSHFEFQFPIRGLEIYFLLFGSAGFFEHQVLIPTPTFAEWTDRLRERLRNDPFPLTLGAAKLFRGDQTLLRFTGDGVCLAVNIPRRRSATRFLAFLDELALATGARPNLIKDSRLPRTVVMGSYPEYELFRERLAGFDPQRRCRSELSERLGL